jgi:hypothetical protein
MEIKHRSRKDDRIIVEKAKARENRTKTVGQPRNGPRLAHRFLQHVDSSLSPPPSRSQENQEDSNKWKIFIIIKE